MFPNKQKQTQMKKCGRFLRRRRWEHATMSTFVTTQCVGIASKIVNKHLTKKWTKSKSKTRKEIWWSKGEVIVIFKLENQGKFDETMFKNELICQWTNIQVLSNVSHRSSVILDTKIKESYQIAHIYLILSNLSLMPI